MSRTTITIIEESELGESSKRGIHISEDTADMDIYDFLSKMIIPALKAFGYSESTVSDIMGDL